jgi:hypothetical protein
MPDFGDDMGAVVQERLRNTVTGLANPYSLKYRAAGYFIRKLKDMRERLQDGDYTQSMENGTPVISVSADDKESAEYAKDALCANGIDAEISETTVPTRLGEDAMTNYSVVMKQSDVDRAIAVMDGQVQDWQSKGDEYMEQAEVRAPEGALNAEWSNAAQAHHEAAGKLDSVRYNLAMDRYKDMDASNLTDTAPVSFDTYTGKDGTAQRIQDRQMKAGRETLQQKGERATNASVREAHAKAKGHVADKVKSTHQARV